MSGEVRSFAFWRNLALYFMSFSFVGHWIEMLAVVLANAVLHESLGYGIMNNFTEPYTIYGLGVVTSVLAIYPFVKKIGRNLPLLYLMSVFVCAVVEYVSALIIVFRFGSNPFWNYSDMPFNLNGYICLRNTLVFGFIAMIFVKWVYPLLEKGLKRLGNLPVNIIFAVVLVLFTISTVVYWK